jgi:hypothetical protein
LAVLNLTFSFAEGLLHCGSELWLTPLVSGVPQRVQSPLQVTLGPTLLGLSLIGIFLYGLPGTIVSSPGQLVFALGNP